MDSTDLQATMAHMGACARAASTAMAAAPTAAKNAALLALARLLRGAPSALQQANQRDIAAATADGLAAPLVDRLRLDAHTIETVAQGCEQIAALPDPIGEITELRSRPSGIQVGRMRVPLGVFGMIYESRPNVTIEAAALAIKSGNACILRGGSEAIHSNLALWQLVQQALTEAGLPPDAVQLVQTTDRAAVGILIASPAAIDVIIPRGGKGLIERISREAKVPVIKHLDGNCHIYVDASADLEMALRVTDNAKTQKYSPCNAAESLLVHADIAAAFLPRIGEVFAAKGVEMRGDEAALALLAEVSGARLARASEQDWSEEYLAPVISIKVVAGLDEAIAHINHYGSHHTDAILTDSHAHAMRFLREVDSASVMVNASTRFADGFEYGLGAEIGISTDKFHARGPVGIDGLTSMKWVVAGARRSARLMAIDPRRALVLFSGGQDSTTCLAWALERYAEVETIGFDYGQRHRVELACRATVRQRLALLPNRGMRLGADHLLDLSLLGQISDTAMTDVRAIEFNAQGLPNTFVPGRNLLFFSFAAAVACRRGLTVLVGGMCETDFSGYPDCRDNTLKALQVAISLGLDGPMTIETPLMWLDKAQTWALAERLGGEPMIDLVVEHTHTCYLGDRSQRHPWGYGCGLCPACDLRRKGYEEWLDGLLRTG